MSERLDYRRMMHQLAAVRSACTGFALVSEYQPRPLVAVDLRFGSELTSQPFNRSSALTQVVVQTEHVHY